MTQTGIRNWLDRPVDVARDHSLGPASAELTLVEYGSYACPHCRAANERIAEVRDRFGDRMRYVFRHRPLTGSDLARRAAALAERADGKGHFWDAHIELMTRSETLTEDDLHTVADDFGLTHDNEAVLRDAQARVDADERSARESGVQFTPTFFINGRRYNGPWDEVSLSDAMLNTLGHRVRTAALDFASWGPSAGVLLLIATVLAIVLSNSPLGSAFAGFWQQDFGFNFANTTFSMSLQHWVNDALLTIFFLVVGLEIKREFTVGHLAGRRNAALPIAAAIGGMLVPALLYILIIPQGPWTHGWGVPMATDTAFAIALIAMMGSRVPVELRIFLTATAIVDDIGAIIVVAIFYSGDLQWAYLAGAIVTGATLAFLTRSRIYRVAPYMLLGLVLWICVYKGGLHATLAGVILALFIPTRPPANLRALTVQADAIIAAEAQRGADVLRHGPSLPALQALDAIHDRVESPADRLLRHAGSRSSYIVLPVFALANAGVVWSSGVLDGNEPLMLAIIAGLVVGKPVGIVCASALAVASGLAQKPVQYTWRQLTGAGMLAGIGFTMSLFIAGQAFPAEAHFAAAKIAVFVASVLSAFIGVLILWGAARASREDSSPVQT
jgi:NhaA family Na+:H+ antiporter